MSGSAGAEELVLPSQLETLDQVDAATLECARSVGFDEKTATDIAIAVIEAVTNAIIHGNRFDEHKVVTVSYDCVDDTLSIVIHDEGDGFDLCMIPDPTVPERHLACSGRGIFIMQQVMDRVEFDMSGGKGTTVTLAKRFRPAG
jgi:serine/threonine-protein kinase RsbW